MNDREYVNKVYNDDVLNILKSLPDESVDMIYADPDYNVNINYSGMNFTKSWDDYIDWYISIIKESFRVLKLDGNLYTINYPKQNAYLRVKYLDSVAYHVNDYVWIYNTNVGHSKKKLTNAHRSILHATKSENNKFYKDNISQPYENLKDKRIQTAIKNGSLGKMPYSWFYYDLVKNVSKDKTTYHPCQIPIKLAEMLFKSCTEENDLIFILFGGSGNEIELCRNINRKYISCEIHNQYYNEILKKI